MLNVIMKNAYFADYIFYNSNVKQKVWLLINDGVIAGYSENEPTDDYERTVFHRSGIFPSFVSAYFTASQNIGVQAAAASGVGSLHLTGVSIEEFKKYLEAGFRVSFSPVLSDNAERYLEECAALIRSYKDNSKVRIAPALPKKSTSDMAERFIKFAQEERVLLCAEDDAVITDKALYYIIPTAETKTPLAIAYRTDIVTRKNSILKLWKEPYKLSLGGVNPFRELRALALIFKGVNMDSTLFSAHDAFLAATLTGAQTLGFNTGELRKGYPADFMVVDFNVPHLQPVYDPVSHLVYAAERADVKALFSAGVRI
jgi:cytosine/adenosine deaminase-related metal-dependent hydrolase